MSGNRNVSSQVRSEGCVVERYGRKEEGNIGIENVGKRILRGRNEKKTIEKGHITKEERSQQG